MVLPAAEGSPPRLAPSSLDWANEAQPDTRNRNMTRARHLTITPTAIQPPNESVRKLAFPGVFIRWRCTKWNTLRTLSFSQWSQSVSFDRRSSGPTAAIELHTAVASVKHLHIGGAAFLDQEQCCGRMGQ